MPDAADAPLGLPVDGSRRESDSIGSVEVPADRYWGAQTQRALEHFAIGDERMPLEIVHAYGLIKRACAIVNARSGRLNRDVASAIEVAADEVACGRMDDEFPLSVWQSGSGTQTNMNVNEVIANRAIQLLGGALGSKEPVHPNDHVNMCQSSNDTFVTAMHVAVYLALLDRTIPAMRRLQDSLAARACEWAGVVKVGRTHLQDATPITVGQEWSGYSTALGEAIDHVEHCAHGLLAVAIGGTAVGTGLNAPPGFGEDVAAELSLLTGHRFHVAPNPYAAQSTLDRVVRAHGALKAAAGTLFKIANDIRWLASGPRAGLAELILPANEPGSSIMPGKVNPTQAESLLMIAIDVMASDVAVQWGGAEGNLELNVFRPLVARHVLRSATHLADACDQFRELAVEGAILNTERIRSYADHSVMVVTALAPEIGYDVAARIAHDAVRRDVSIREAAMAAGIDASLVDELLDPARLTSAGFGRG